MGLDMYLYAADDDYIDAVKNDVASDYETSEVNNYYNKHGDLDYVYWRKANAIHRFFCEHGECLDRQTYYIVNRKHVESLIEKCREILVDHEKADMKLPTQEGFFFGSVGYDDYYFEDILYTLESLVMFLEHHKDQSRFVYYASW